MLVNKQTQATTIIGGTTPIQSGGLTEHGVVFQSDRHVWEFRDGVRVDLDFSQTYVPRVVSRFA